MLSKNSIKYINSLRVKKYRNELCIFIAEGERLVDDIMQSSMCIRTIYHTLTWDNSKINGFESVLISEDEMKKISGLSTASNVLALVSIPDYKVNTIELSKSLSLALDGIQDPGNLGTIIRLSDWFGIETIICSNETVDAFSPKVIQSCMGAISRVKVIYSDLSVILSNYRKEFNLPVYGTFMDGGNIYSENLSATGIIVMGNEGNGISREIEMLVSNKIHIPSFAQNRSTVESLNVAMATAIVCSEFKRRSIK